MGNDSSPRKTKRRVIPLATSRNQGEQVPESAPIIPAVPAPEPAAALMEEILDQTVQDALNSARLDQLIGPKPDQEVQKGTAYSSSGWLHSPAQLELLAQADWRLARVANLKRTDDAQINQVDRVEAKLVPGTKLLILRPALDQDLTAAPVNRYAGQSGAWINLFDLLKPAKLTVTTGYRQLYTVSYVPKTSPLWPALVIDLGKPLERRQQPKRKKGEG